MMLASCKGFLTFGLFCFPLTSHLPEHFFWLFSLQREALMLELLFFGFADFRGSSAHLFRLTFACPVLFSWMLSFIQLNSNGLCSRGVGLCFLFPLCDYNIAQLFSFCKMECCTNKDICNCANYRLLFLLFLFHWQTTYVCAILTVNLAALSSGPILYFTISLATWMPLAEAWDREWVMPEPSPIIYIPS